jgi:uncharacterized protein YbdZ (MbtH family)
MRQFCGWRQKRTALRVKGVLTGRIRNFGENPDWPCWPPLQFAQRFAPLDSIVWRTDEHQPDNGSFSLLVNDDEQHNSLWPALAGVPAGWRVVCGEAEPAAFLDYIEQNSHKSRSA